MPRKRKSVAEKRNVQFYEERRLPSLASTCVKVDISVIAKHEIMKSNINVLQVITKHIDDVEALGDIGNMNVDEIAKAIAKDRSL